MEGKEIFDLLKSLRKEEILVKDVVLRYDSKLAIYKSIVSKLAY